MRHKLFILAAVAATLCACMDESARFRKELALAAPVVNDRCPINTELGSLQRVFYENDTLCALLSINTNSVDFRAIQQNEQSFVDAMLIHAAAEGDSTISAYLGKMGQYGVPVRLRIANTARKDEDFRTVITPGRMDSIFSGKMSTREKARRQVEVQTILVQRQLPYRMDSLLTLNKVSLDKNQVLMQYSVTEGREVNLAREAVRTTAQLVIRQRIWDELMRSRNQSAIQMLKLYHDAELEIRYICTGNQSGQQVEAVFTNGDIRMLLSHNGVTLN